MKKYVGAQPTVALFGYLLRFSRYFERTELHKINAEQDWARPGLTMILPSAPARWGPIGPRRDWHEWAAILSSIESVITCVGDPFQLTASNAYQGIPAVCSR